MVDLIKLPYRNYGVATSVDWRLNVMSDYPVAQNEYYGRVIQLHPFISGQICKYKLIENYGDKIYERIFLMSKSITPDDIWWRGDEHLLYPIQCKVISGDNCVAGRSFKYTQGILHYIQDYQETSVINTPVFSMVAPTNNLASLIIPSPEEQAVAFDMSGIVSFSGPYDQWLKNDVNIAELYPNLRYSDVDMSGLISLASTDEIMQGVLCIDTDPLEADWATWELICELNEIVATDVSITAYHVEETSTITGITTNVKMSSRYNFVYDNDIQYGAISSLLSRLTYNFIKSRLKDTNWEKIEIRKLWSEEVFIDIYEKSNPAVISQVLYFDLPVFSLGTLGIHSRMVSYLHNN